MQGNRKTAKAVEKPVVGRIDLPNGTVRLIGVSAAARYLGCSQPALHAVARGIPNRGNRLAERAKAEFPGLFSKQS